MAGDNFVLSYYQGIKDGTYQVGRWVRLVYEYLVKGLENKLFYFDQKKATAAIDWYETHCFHTEGPLAPSPLKLEVWQKALVSAMFGIVDEHGNRQFREVFLLVGRKNGKTKMASGAGSYVWRRDGGFGSRVFCLAPRLDQANLVYGDIWLMTQLDPEYIELKESLEERDVHNKRVNDDSMLPRHRQSELAIPGINAQVKKIPLKEKTANGYNPTLGICDEIASWEGDKGLKAYEVIKSGAGAQAEPLILSCTTSGYINDGIFDELMKRSTRFLLGDSKETRLLPVLYMIDDVAKWNDLNELRKSNPNLGVSISYDYMLEEIAVAEGSLSKKAEFLTKYCCVKQNSSLAFLDAQTVERATGEHMELSDFADHYAVCGIDLSQTTDLSACVAVIEKNGELYVFAQFFLPAEKIEEATARDGVPYLAYINRGILTPSGENFIDYRDCFEWFRRLVQDYRIYPLKTGFDRYSAQYLIQDLQGAGLHLDDVYQGDNLYPIIMEAEGLLKDGKIHIGDNDLLKVHMLNCALKMNAERGRGKLVKINPTSHIDGFCALIDALTVRAKYYGEIGAQLKN